MISEFDLIDAIVTALGDRAKGDLLAVGPGDDAAVIRATPGLHQVASIDSLLADVHFPKHAPAALIGYRALMVSLSDLAAMAATPRYCMIALTLDQSLLEDGSKWLQALAVGMAEAARACDVVICGGNLSQGPLNISVSVHGEVAPSQILRRQGGKAGDKLYVSGAIGGAAACVRTGSIHELNHDSDGDALSALQRAYYRPKARVDLRAQLQDASCGIDISDGLIQDLAHLCAASGCGARVDSQAIALLDGATLDDVFTGSDDYELLVASAKPMPGWICIGYLTEATGVAVEGVLSASQLQLLQRSGGYDHFR